MVGAEEQSMCCLLANRRCALVTDPTHDPTLGRYQRLATAAHLSTAGNIWIQRCPVGVVHVEACVRAFWLPLELHSMSSVSLETAGWRAFQ